MQYQQNYAVTRSPKPGFVADQVGAQHPAEEGRHEEVQRGVQRVEESLSLGLSLTKWELSTQQKQTAHKTDRFVENDVEYEQNYAARVRGFVQYNTEVDIRFIQTRTYDNSSGPAIKYEETHAVKVRRVVKYNIKPDIVFAVTRKILVLGSPLTKLELSTQVKPHTKKKYERTYTAEVDRFVGYIKVDIRFT